MAQRDRLRLLGPDPGSAPRGREVLLPRADQQEYDPGFGTELPFTGSYDGLQRLDQVYFPGHVAVMVNETDAMHAKGEDVRKLVIEPIREIDAWRIRDCAGGIRTVKRF